MRELHLGATWPCCKLLLLTDFSARHMSSSPPVAFHGVQPRALYVYPPTWTLLSCCWLKFQPNYAVKRYASIDSAGLSSISYRLLQNSMPSEAYRQSQIYIVQTLARFARRKLGTVDLRTGALRRKPSVSMRHVERHFLSYSIHWSMTSNVSQSRKR
jgi:hypothetical protein